MTSPSDPPEPAEPAAERPEYGPSGYLPERASKRARKIVLRAPLGLQWVVASLVAGVVVVVAGVLFLQTSGGPPGAPFVEVGPVESVGDATLDPDTGILFVAAGRIRAFADTGGTDVAYCPESRRLEAPDGRVWSMTGRGYGGTASLTEHPTRVVDGILYVDPTTTVPGPTPTDEVAEPACAGR